MNSAYAASVIACSVLLSACGAGVSERHRNENEGEAACAIAAPPRDSRKVPMHGANFYIYPGTLPSAYSGCQTMWLEDGSKIAVARYVDGKIRSFSSTEPKQEPFECSYSPGGSVTYATAEEQCPPTSEFPM